MAIGKGRGVGGGSRRGKPKTDAERRVEHQRRFGTKKLPKRGTGLKRKKKKFRTDLLSYG